MPLTQMPQILMISVKSGLPVTVTVYGLCDRCSLCSAFERVPSSGANLKLQVLKIQYQKLRKQKL